MAFGIYLVEKEFHVGMIDSEFPLLKFWNLLDKTNNRKYNKMMNSGNSKGGVNTLG